MGEWLWLEGEFVDVHVIFLLCFLLFSHQLGESCSFALFVDTPSNQRVSSISTMPGRVVPSSFVGAVQKSATCEMQYETLPCALLGLTCMIITQRSSEQHA